MRDYQGEFEVHVTARLSDSAAVERLGVWCLAHECKFAHIVLARGTHPEQPMVTWRRCDTKLPIVVTEAKHLIAQLNCAAIPVVRLKVEAAPENAGVPQTDVEAAVHDANNYFEHHVKLLRGVTTDRESLVQVCLTHGAHLSRNARRNAAEGLEERFATLRCHGVGWGTAQKRLQQMLAALAALGEQVLEIESEYAVYDSNHELDADWLPPIS